MLGRAIEESVYGSFDWITRKTRAPHMRGLAYRQGVAHEEALEVEPLSRGRLLVLVHDVASQGREVVPVVLCGSMMQKQGG